MIPALVQAGDPVLRRPARPLTPEEIRGPAIQELVAAMCAAMRAAPGVGLAAPQVGESVQLVVIEDPPALQARLTEAERREREREPVPLQVLCNPILTVEDPAPLEFFEGCLSVAGWMALVRRARAVRVDAFDGAGAPVTVRARGWHARILQHEVDHLAGTLCVDRMEPRSLTTTENHARHWRARPIAEVRSALGLPPA